MRHYQNKTGSTNTETRSQTQKHEGGRNNQGFINQTETKKCYCQKVWNQNTKHSKKTLKSWNKDYEKTKLKKTQNPVFDTQGPWQCAAEYQVSLSTNRFLNHNRCPLILYKQDLMQIQILVICLPEEWFVVHLGMGIIRQFKVIIL